MLPGLTAAEASDVRLQALRSAFQEHVTEILKMAMVVYSTDKKAAGERFRTGFELAWEFYVEQRRELAR